MSEQKEITTTGQRAVSAFSSMQAFEDAQRMAKALCSSPLVPKEYQGEANLGSAVIALELAQRMNASPLMVMQNLDIIHGRPSWRAQMIIAAVNACGRFSPVRYEMGGTDANPSCRAYAHDKANGERLDGPKIDVAMAKAEGWYGKSGSKWQTIPELMLRYRAAAWWGRQYAPELLMGLPTVEESYDVIDITPEAVRVDEEPESRVASVAAKVSAAAGNGTQSDTAEWPAKNADGTWIDSRGVTFHAEVHGMSGHKPAVSRAGHFCKRRGCDPALHAQIERDALNAISTPPASEEDGSPPDEPETAETGAQEARSDNAKGPSSYPDIRTAISRAASLGACEEAADLLRSFQGADDLRKELESFLEERSSKIASLMGNAK